MLFITFSHPMVFVPSFVDFQSLDMNTLLVFIIICLKILHYGFQKIIY